MARSLGGTLGLAIASAAYQNTLKNQLWAHFGSQPGAADIIGRIRDDLDQLHRLPDGWYDGTIASFMDAFRAVWLTMLGWAVLNLVCSFPMKQHKLYSTLDRR